MTDPRFERYRTAYREMAKHARYRPIAPGDGSGGIDLTDDELRDPAILDQEARAYAADFVRQDDMMEYLIGCPDFATNKAFCFTIEAARALCGGQAAVAKTLLTMALDEIAGNSRDKR